jgi:starch-binding outer membrane protein, SusD/RagB family
LMFEGKRWFDLVRMARREGNNDNLINFVINKHKSNTSAIRIRMKTVDGLYFPYSESELKLNKYLKQNPVYITDESTTLSE